MPTINFNYDINVSLQKGDELFVSKLVGGQGGSNHPNTSIDTKPKKLGDVDVVNHINNSVTYTAVSGAPSLTTNHFIMFNKNRLVSYSGITGYYAETEYRNWSTLPAEIFATAVDYVESSS